MKHEKCDNFGAVYIQFGQPFKNSLFSPHDPRPLPFYMQPGRLSICNRGQVREGSAFNG